jgi:hypothetical protein
MELIGRRPEIVLAHTAVDMVDADLRPLEHYGIRLATDGADPARRFSEMVLPWSLCFEVFGVMPTDLVRELGGMPNYSHGDGILLAALALRGPFGFIDAPLFISRQHAEQSNKQFGGGQGGNDYHAYAAWFDPSYEGKLQFPNWKIIREFQRVLSSTRGLSYRERLRCEWTLARRCRQDVRLLAADLGQGATYLRSKVRCS